MLQDELMHLYRLLVMKLVGSKQHLLIEGLLFAI